jgi:hypothetical protein
MYAEGNMANVFPTYLTKWTTSRVKDEGVEIKSKHSIKSIDGAEGDKVKLTLWLLLWVLSLVSRLLVLPDWKLMTSGRVLL